MVSVTGSVVIDVPERLVPCWWLPAAAMATSTDSILPTTVAPRSERHSFDDDGGWMLLAVRYSTRARQMALRWHVSMFKAWRSCEGEAPESRVTCWEAV